MARVLGHLLRSRPSTYVGRAGIMCVWENAVETILWANLDTVEVAGPKLLLYPKGGDDPISVELRVQPEAARARAAVLRAWQAWASQAIWPPVEPPPLPPGMNGGSRAFVVE